MIKSVDNYNTITKHISDVILSTLVRRKSWLFVNAVSILVLYRLESSFRYQFIDSYYDNTDG